MIFGLGVQNAGGPGTPSIDGWIDVVDPRQVTLGGNLHVEGWASSFNANDGGDLAPVQRVEIYVDGQLVGNARLGFPRADVPINSGYGASSLASGWIFDLTLTGYPGRHVLSAVAYDRFGNSMTLNNSPAEFSVVGDVPTNILPLSPNAPAPVVLPAPAAPTPVILPSNNPTAVNLPGNPSVSVAAASWFSGSTDLAGFQIPNLGLVGAAALALLMFSKKK